MQIMLRSWVVFFSQMRSSVTCNNWFRVCSTAMIGGFYTDIKGSDLLIDKEGMLKIADFGLSNYYSPKQKQPLMTRVVTLWLIYQHKEIGHTIPCLKLHHTEEKSVMLELVDMKYQHVADSFQHSALAQH
uniref:Protein kinase domain-containing protein n=1 Tax=Salix viminalis TaxID=40686 RepID=A0A6N2NH23_SALVM